MARTQTNAPATVTLSKADLHAKQTAETFGAKLAQSIAAADGEGYAVVAKAKADLETAGRNELARVVASLNGVAAISAEVYAATIAKPLEAALVASGRYAVDDKGVAMGARSRASLLKPVILAVSNGHIPNGTTLSQAASACRTFCYGKGLMKAPPAPNPDDQRKKGKGKNTPAPVVVAAKPLDAYAAACMLCLDDVATAKRLVTVCEEDDTFARLAAFLQELVTPSRGRRLPG